MCNENHRVMIANNVSCLRADTSPPAAYVPFSSTSQSFSWTYNNTLRVNICVYVKLWPRGPTTRMMELAGDVFGGGVADYHVNAFNFDTVTRKTNHPWSDGRQEVAVLLWSSLGVRVGGKTFPFFCHHSSGTNSDAKASTRESKGG